jgi:hypothetical protein
MDTSQMHSLFSLILVQVPTSDLFPSRILYIYAGYGYGTFSVYISVGTSYRYRTHHSDAYPQLNSIVLVIALDTVPY